MRMAGLVFGSLALAELAGAGQADVVLASARCSAESVCSFRVSVKHSDEGWGHYADRWEILAPDGELLATRILRHPHVNEQPFARSLAGVKIPRELESVRVRARDSKHGFGGQEISVSLERLAVE
jgi:hypothetical protein